MPKIVRRPFCTMYKRTESEKKVYEMTKEFDNMKEEIRALKEQVEGQSTKKTK